MARMDSPEEITPQAQEVSGVRYERYSVVVQDMAERSRGGIGSGSTVNQITNKSI